MCNSIGRLLVNIRCLLIALLLMQSPLALGQSCNTDRLEILKKKFEKISSGSQCFRLSPALSDNGARSICFRKNPPNIKIISDLKNIQEEYGAIALNCDDKFKLTWVGFLEQMNLFCEVFLAKDSFEGILNLDKLPQRIARAGIQCLKDHVEFRDDTRPALISFIKLMFDTTTPELWTKLRKNLLSSMLDSFAYVGVQNGSPNTSLAAIASAISGNPSILDSEWKFFLSSVADQFDFMRNKLSYSPNDQQKITNQLGLVEGVLKN